MRKTLESELAKRDVWIASDGKRFFDRIEATKYQTDLDNTRITREEYKESINRLGEL